VSVIFVESFFSKYVIGWFQLFLAYPNVDFKMIVHTFLCLTGENEPTKESCAPSIPCMILAGMI